MFCQYFVLPLEFEFGGLCHFTSVQRELGLSVLVDGNDAIVALGFESVVFANIMEEFVCSRTAHKKNIKPLKEQRRKLIYITANLS